MSVNGSDVDGSASLSHMELLDVEPPREAKAQMRKATKRPSEWLRLLCRDWASENEALVDACDEKFLEYKPYLKGMLTSQLLCRLSIPVSRDPMADHHHHPHNNSGHGGGSHHGDFWRILGIVDEFDKSYIVAQIERFCAMYNIRGLPEENESLFAPTDLASQDAASMAAAAAAGISLSPNGGIVGIPPYIDPHTAAAAAVAAAAATNAAAHAHAQAPSPTNAGVAAHHAPGGIAGGPSGLLSKKQTTEVSRAQRMAKDAEKALEQERRQNQRKEQKRLSQERKEQKQREREALAQRKAQERTERESTREERRKKKLEIRQQREKFAQEQKELALKRAAELVSSNRVPIEITRGAAAAKAAANAALAAGGHQPPPPEPVAVAPSKKPRSAIVVSTAADLHQIVTHSKNLWAKYNAIAKEHNQKVNWITVAKELGIHVKVREKYARMHSRAEQRGFDWVKYGYWKIKDHPEIFIEPTESEQKAKMPLPPPDTNTTVLIAGTKEVSTLNSVLEGNDNNNQHQQHHQVPHAQHDNRDVAVTEESVAAAARVVDASGVTQTQTHHQHHHHHQQESPQHSHMGSLVSHSQEQTAAAAAVAASLVADPTAGLAQHHEESYHGLKAQPAQSM